MVDFEALRGDQRGPAPKQDGARTLVLAINSRINLYARSFANSVYWDRQSAQLTTQNATHLFQDLSRERSAIRDLARWSKYDSGLANLNSALINSGCSAKALEPIVCAVNVVVKEGIKVVNPKSLRNQPRKDTRPQVLHSALPAAAGLITTEVELKLRNIMCLVESMMREHGTAELQKKSESRFLNGVRVHSSFMSGDLAQEIDMNVRAEFSSRDVTTLFLLFGIDGSPVSNSEELIPIACRILNYPRRIHSRSFRLLGYMSSVEFETQEFSNTEAGRDTERFALSAQFIKLFNQLGEIQRGGPIEVCGVLIYPALAPCTLNLKEKVGLLNMSGGYNHCPDCYALAPFTEYEEREPRNWGMTRLIIQWSRVHYEKPIADTPSSLGYAYSGARTQMKLLF